jgi:hypothetical protein
MHRWTRWTFLTLNITLFFAFWFQCNLFFWQIEHVPWIGCVTFRSPCIYAVKIGHMLVFTSQNSFDNFLTDMHKRKRSQQKERKERRKKISKFSSFTIPGPGLCVSVPFLYTLFNFIWCDTRIAGFWPYAFNLHCSKSVYLVERIQYGHTKERLMNTSRSLSNWTSTSVRRPSVTCHLSPVSGSHNLFGHGRQSFAYFNS